MNNIPHAHFGQNMPDRQEHTGNQEQQHPFATFFQEIYGPSALNLPARTDLQLPSQATDRRGNGLPVLELTHGAMPTNHSTQADTVPTFHTAIGTVPSENLLNLSVPETVPISRPLREAVEQYLQAAGTDPDPPGGQSGQALLEQLLRDAASTTSEARDSARRVLDELIIASQSSGVAGERARFLLCRLSQTAAGNGEFADQSRQEILALAQRTTAAGRGTILTAMLQAAAEQGTAAELPSFLEAIARVCQLMGAPAVTADDPGRLPATVMERVWHLFSGETGAQLSSEQQQRLRASYVSLLLSLSSREGDSSGDDAIVRLRALVGQDSPVGQAALDTLLSIVCQADPHNAEQRALAEAAATSLQHLPSARIESQLQHRFPLDTVDGINRLAALGEHEGLSDTIRRMLLGVVAAHRPQAGEDEQNRSLREAAVRQLVGWIHDSSGFTEIAQALGQPLRDCVLQLLGCIDDPQVRQVLGIRLMQESTSQTSGLAERTAAVELLIHFTDQVTAPVCQNLAQRVREMSGNSAECQQFRTAVADLANRVLLSSGADAARQGAALDMLAATGAEIPSDFALPVPGTQVDRAVVERALSLAGAPNEASSQDSQWQALRFLLQVARSQPEHAELIRSGLRESAIAQDRLLDNLAHAAASAENQTERQFARDILQSISSISAAQAGRVSAALAGAFLVTMNDTTDPGRLQSLQNELMTLVQQHPQSVLRRLQEDGGEQAVRAICAMVACTNAVVREQAGRALLAVMANHQPSQRHRLLLEMLCPLLSNTTAEQIAPLMAAVALGRGEVDAQMPWQELSQRAQQGNESAIVVLTSLACLNSDLGRAAAMTLQQAAGSSPTSRERIAEMVRGTLCHHAGDLRALPLLNAFANITLEQFSHTVTATGQAAEERLRQAILRIGQIGGYNSGQPLFDRRAYFPLLARLLTGDAGHLAAQAVENIPDLAGGNGEFGAELRQALRQAYERHGDRDLLVRQLVLVTGSPTERQSLILSFIQDAARLSTPPVNESADQQLRRAQALARVVNGLSMMERTTVQPLTEQQINSICSDSTLRTAFLRAGQSWARVLATACQANVEIVPSDVQNIREFLLAIGSSSLPQADRNGIARCIEGALRCAMSRCQNPAAQAAIFDFLRSTPNAAQIGNTNLALLEHAQQTLGENPTNLELLRQVLTLVPSNGPAWVAPQATVDECFRQVTGASSQDAIAMLVRLAEAEHAPSSLPAGTVSGRLCELARTNDTVLHQLIREMAGGERAGGPVQAILSRLIEDSFHQSSPSGIASINRIYMALRQPGISSVVPCQALLRQIINHAQGPYTVLRNTLVAPNSTAEHRNQALTELLQIAREPGPQSELAFYNLVRAASATTDNAALNRTIVERLTELLGPGSGAQGTISPVLSRFIEQAREGGREAQMLLLQLSRLSPQLKAQVFRSILGGYRADSHHLLPLMAAIAEGRELPPPPANASQLIQQCRQAVDALSQGIQRLLVGSGGQNSLDGLMRRRMNDEPPANATPEQAATAFQQRFYRLLDHNSLTGGIIHLLAITASANDSLGEAAAAGLTRLSQHSNSMRSMHNIQSWRATIFDTYMVDQCMRAYAGGNLPAGGAYLLNLVVHLAHPPQMNPNTGQSQWSSYVHQPASASQVLALLQSNPNLAVIEPGMTALSRGLLPHLASLALGGRFGADAQVAARTLLERTPHLLNPTPGIDNSTSVAVWSTQQAEAVVQLLTNGTAESRARLLSTGGLNSLPVYVRQHPERCNSVVTALLSACQEQSGSDRLRFLQTICLIASASPDSNSQPALQLLEQQAGQSNRAAITTLAMLACGHGSPATCRAGQEALARIASQSATLRGSIVQELLSFQQPTADVISCAAAVLSGVQQIDRSNGSEQRALETLGRLAQENSRDALQFLFVAANGSANAEAVRTLALRQIAQVAHLPQTGYTNLDELLGAIRQRASVQSDPACLQILLAMGSTERLPISIRSAALEALVQAATNNSGNQNERNERMNRVVDLVLQQWRARHSQATFQLMARLSALCPQRADLRQEVMQGYGEQIQGGSTAEGGLNRLGSALAMLANPQLLTPDVIAQLSRTITPEMAQALADVEHLPQSTLRQFLSALRQQCQPPSGSDGTGQDLAAVAQSFASLARLATREDVMALQQLQGRATSDGERNAINRALFTLLTQAQDAGARREAFNLFRNSPQWSHLPQPLKAAVSSFAESGRGDLNHLREACDRILGPSARYALAVTLRLCQVGGNDDELCQLSERILARTEYGSTRTLQNWVIPILSAATAAVNDPSLQLGEPAQFMRAVANDLAEGTLAPARQFLASYVDNLSASGEQLLADRNRIMSEIASISQQLQSGPQRLLQALQNQEEIRQQALQTNSNQIPQLGPSPPAGQAQLQMAQQEIDAASNLTQLQQRLQQLQADLQTVNNQLTNNERLRLLSQYHSLCASGLRVPAVNVMYQILGQGVAPPASFQPEVDRVWAQLRAQGLAPSDQPPGAPVSLEAAFAVLRNLNQHHPAESGNIDAHNLHLGAVDAAASACLRQIMANPHVATLTRLSQDVALRFPAIMEYLRIGTQSQPPPSRETRQILATQLQSQCQQLCSLLQSNELNQARVAVNALCNQLREQLNQLTPGGVEHQRLSQLYRTLDNYCRVLDPQNGTLRTLQNTVNALVNDDIMNTSLWREALNTTAHVVVTTAAFALAAALSASAGPAAPVVFALLGPTLTVAGRQLTQEAIHYTGVAAHGLLGEWAWLLPGGGGSHLGDHILGRTIFDPVTQEFRLRSGGESMAELGNEYGHEFLMNLAFMGTGALAGRAGSFLGARWPHLANLLPGAAHAPATSFGGIFRQNFTGPAIGWGLASAAPDLAGIPYLGTFIGFGLAGYHGFRDGLAHGAQGRAIPLHERPMSASERQEWSSRLGVGPNHRAVEAAVLLPPALRAQVLQMICELGPPGQGRRTALLQVLSGLPALDAAALVANLHQMTPAQRGTLIDRLNGAPNSTLAVLLARCVDGQAAIGLSDSINAVDVGQRAQLLQILRTAPTELVAGLGHIADPSVRARMLETLQHLAGSQGFSESQQRLMRELPRQQLAAFLDGLTQIQEPVARGRVGQAILSHPQAARLVEALVLVTDPIRRAAALEAISTLPEGNQRALFDSLSRYGDASNRAHFLQELGANSLTPAERSAALRIICDITPEQRRNALIQLLSGVSAEQTPATLRALSLLTDHPNREAILAALVDPVRRASMVHMLSSPQAANYLARMRDSGLTLEQALRISALPQNHRQQLEQRLAQAGAQNWHAVIDSVIHAPPAETAIAPHVDHANVIASLPAALQAHFNEPLRLALQAIDAAPNLNAVQRNQLANFLAEQLRNVPIDRAEQLARRLRESSAEPNFLQRLRAWEQEGERRCPLETFLRAPLDRPTALRWLDASLLSNRVEIGRRMIELFQAAENHRHDLAAMVQELSSGSAPTTAEGLNRFLDDWAARQGPVAHLLADQALRNLASQGNLNAVRGRLNTWLGNLSRLDASARYITILDGLPSGTASAEQLTNYLRECAARHSQLAGFIQNNLIPLAEQGSLSEIRRRLGEQVHSVALPSTLNLNNFIETVSNILQHDQAMVQQLAQIQRLHEQIAPWQECRNRIAANIPLTNESFSQDATGLNLDRQILEFFMELIRARNSNNDRGNNQGPLAFLITVLRDLESLVPGGLNQLAEHPELLRLARLITRTHIFLGDNHLTLPQLSNAVPPAFADLAPLQWSYRDNAEASRQFIAQMRAILPQELVGAIVGQPDGGAGVVINGEVTRQTPESRLFFGSNLIRILTSGSGDNRRTMVMRFVPTHSPDCAKCYIDVIGPNGRHETLHVMWRLHNGVLRLDHVKVEDRGCVELRSRLPRSGSFNLSQQPAVLRQQLETTLQRNILPAPARDLVQRLLNNDTLNASQVAELRTALGSIDVMVYIHSNPAQPPNPPVALHPNDQSFQAIANELGFQGQPGVPSQQFLSMLEAQVTSIYRPSAIPTPQAQAPSTAGSLS